MRLSHCFGACALLATLTAASVSSAAPATTRHADAVQPSRENLDSLIQFLDAHTVENNPNAIDPCWLIDRNFFTSVNLSEYRVQAQVHYISGGKHITRTVSVSLADAIIVRRGDPDHQHGDFAPSQWVQLRLSIDVSAAPVDANTAIEGTIRLFKTAEGHEA